MDYTPEFPSHKKKTDVKQKSLILLNDNENQIDFYLEEKLYKSEYVNFHPLTNIATITMQLSKFIAFMIENKKKIHIFSTKEEKVIKVYE